MLEPTFRSGLNREPEHILGLKDVIALDADAAGNVYALQRQGNDQIGIVVLDGRLEVLEAQQRQGSIQGPARITSPSVAYAVHIQPTVDFDVRGMQVAPSGLYLLLHGVSCQDSSVIAMAVVDLHGGQPTAASGARGGHATRVKSCRLHPVDPMLFGSRPGLILHQVDWHPHSEEHLVVLTSDNRLRLYHVTHTLAAAEQTLQVVLAAKALPQRYGLGVTASPGTLGTAAGSTNSDAPTSDVVAFAFGPAVGWGLFAFLLLAADGRVYSLGPVAPFGMRCPSSLLERLVREKGAASEWLNISFGADAVSNPAAKNRWPVLPHVVEGASPAVVGPLNPGTDHETTLMKHTISLSVSHILISATADSGSLSSVSTVIVASAHGRLFAYATAGPWEPVWCESAPQYMSITGTAGAAPSAVRYKCTIRAAGTGTGPSKIAATPFMVLLDIVEVPHTLPRHGTGKLDPGAFEDEDDDDDAFVDGYGASASAIAAARSSMSIHIQAGVTGSGAVVVGLGTAARAAVTVWVCQRASTCWRITLPWSGLLAQWLTDAAVPQQGRRDDGAVPSQLPAPLVTCVYDGTAASKESSAPVARDTAADSTAAVGSCLLQNPMLGGGLLVLTVAGVLHYFQPAGAASLIMEQQQQQQMATLSPRDQQQQQRQATSGSGTSTGITFTPGASPEQRKAQVEAHIGLMYGNLMVPPSGRNLPAPYTGSPKPLPVASSEGLVYLIDCITTLRGKHMAFLHGGAVDLQSRADALHAESGKHAAAVADLVGVAAALEARQETLETRLSRVKLLHGNLIERAGMLTSLHWAMPRALSRAEIAAAGELSEVELRVKSLQRQWDTTSARARRLCEQRRSRCGSASVRVTSIPEVQLEKVQDAVMGQSSGLAAARSALTNLEQIVNAAAADQAAERLQKGLCAPGRVD
ncbi:hypothetical protein VaNZ11_004016 [Volvox africanus]|uniref:Nucleoporin Nup88 n=1 Tax=Volvox africanus TaxID=51714 RepID=A0ABQ5RWF3_9CHLO|nr:hypothetical protein VaNZ11_004016 [Volvox africanus]